MASASFRGGGGGKIFLEIAVFIPLVFVVFASGWRFPAVRWLGWFGRNSLVVFATHVLVLNAMDSAGKAIQWFEEYPLATDVLTFALVIATSILLTRFLGRYLPWTVGRRMGT